MTCSVTDTLRGLLVITIMLGIRGQTLSAQAAPTASSPDSGPVRAPSTSGPDWTGLYVGAHTGVSSGASAWSATGPGVPNTYGSLDIFQPYGVFDGSGSQFGGLVIGYNHRLSSQIVIGVEAASGAATLAGSGAKGTVVPTVRGMSWAAAGGSFEPAPSAWATTKAPTATKTRPTMRIVRSSMPWGPSSA